MLNSAVARFPGDPDIVASANYIKYNRARQGKLHVRLHSNRSLASVLGPLSANALGSHLLTRLELTSGDAVQVGDVVPMESIQLASLEGKLSSLRQHLATDSRPVAIVAGSIT